MVKQSSVQNCDSWYILDADQPRLLGTCCKNCGTYYFPKQPSFCKNSNCHSHDFDEVPLSSRGKVWSYTKAHYQPAEPFQTTSVSTPATLAAVKLEKEQMVLLGQVSDGVSIDDMQVGDDMEVVLDTIYEDDNHTKVIWKWKPV